jgi:hypothetical protein
MVGFIDAQIERPTELEKILETNDRQRTQYELAAAVIPGEQELDRLLRYETHLSREIDRILDRPEQLQQMRKERQSPPQLDVNIT